MTIGTRVYTWLNGELVGTDEFGNKYYRNKKKLQGRERRWTLYKGISEASKVPPEWHAWLHHTVADPLTEEATQAKEWQKEHLPNLTGTEHAYYPQGDARKGMERPSATGDYQAWQPE